LNLFDISKYLCFVKIWFSLRIFRSDISEILVKAVFATTRRVPDY
jgi:hypothetical protein